MAAAGNPNWPNVTGRFDDDNANWPVPEWQAATPLWATLAQWTQFTDFAIHARSAVRVEEMKEIAALFKDPAPVCSDELSIQMEWSGAPADGAFRWIQ